jgi:hypothetical protein
LHGSRDRLEQLERWEHLASAVFRANEGCRLRGRCGKIDRIERDLFDTFSVEWAGFNIQLVMGEIWSSAHIEAAQTLRFELLNGYPEYHRIIDKRGSRALSPKIATADCSTPPTGSATLPVPQLMGVTRGSPAARAIAKHSNVANGLFRFEPPSLNLDDRERELVRFLLKLPPRIVLKRKTVSNKLTNLFNTLGELDPKLSVSLSRLSASERREELIKHFGSRPWEVRPYPNSRRAPTLSAADSRIWQQVEDSIDPLAQPSKRKKPQGA